MYSYSFPEYNYDFNYGNGYGNFYGIENSVLGGIFIALILFVMFALAVSLVCYIINAIGLYTLAKRRGNKNAYFAFIPIASAYLTGEIADSIGLTMNKKTGYARKILLLYIVSFAIPFASFPLTIISTITSSILKTYSANALLSWISIILSVASSIVSICCQVYVYISLYKIYKEYVPTRATLYLVLGIIFPVTAPFFMFSIRNKKSGYELWCEQRQREQEAQQQMQQDEIIEDNDTVIEVEQTEIE